MTENEFQTNVAFVSKVGDLDVNGADELGVVLSDGTSVVVYGDAGIRNTVIDLADPTSAEFIALQGVGDVLSLFDSPFVALGDTNNDGLDDVGIGWNARSFNSGVIAIEDINSDGVQDIQLERNGTEVIQRLNYFRVLYGFGAEGFTGLSGEPSSVQPVIRVGDQVFDELVGYK